MTDQPLKDALQAVLLFHSASPWTEEKKYEWRRIACNLLGQNADCEATTRKLCDMVRAALKQAETQPVP